MHYVCWTKRCILHFLDFGCTLTSEENKLYNIQQEDTSIKASCSLFIVCAYFLIKSQLDFEAIKRSLEISSAKP